MSQATDLLFHFSSQQHGLIQKLKPVKGSVTCVRGFEPLLPQRARLDVLLHDHRVAEDGMLAVSLAAGASSEFLSQARLPL